MVKASETSCRPINRFQDFVTMRTLALIATAGLLTVAQPASAQQADLTLEQRQQCTAMFLVQSKIVDDAEEKDAFEAAVAFMLRSAFPLGQARGLTEDQMVDGAAAFADDIEARMLASGSGEAAGEILWGYGPTMQRCLDVVLAS